MAGRDELHSSDYSSHHLREAGANRAVGPEWGIYGENQPVSKPKKRFFKSHKPNALNNPVYDKTLFIQEVSSDENDIRSDKMVSDHDERVYENFPSQKEPLYEEVPCSVHGNSRNEQANSETGSEVTTIPQVVVELCESYSSESEYSYADSFDLPSHNNELSAAEDTDNVYENFQEIQVDGPVASARAPTPPPVETLEEIKQKRSTKRFHVLKELINTERDFLNDTNITIDDIMIPLSEHELPLEVRLETLFGNITEVRDFSASFLASLEEHQHSAAHGSPEEMNVGRIFIEHIPRMKEVYKVYCRNHDDATTMLEKFEDDPDFRLPVQECLNNVKTKVNTFDLGSFLIKPVQRILKYPLLLQELLKLTDVAEPSADNSCYRDLIEANKLIEDVANLLNEEKRKKDLVRKYRKGSQQGTLSGKIARISLHSVKKKSARMTLRIGHVTGLGTPETVDEKFNEMEQKFKAMERAIKTFLQNCETFLTRFRDWLKSEHVLMEGLPDLLASDQGKMVVGLWTATKRISERLFRNFHDQLQLRVLSPLSSMLVRFKGPQAIIEKRFDKLLDYESTQKRSDSKENIQMARNVYEALNQQLLDELPKLLVLSDQVLVMCVAIFIELMKTLQSAAVKELNSVVENMNVEQTFADGGELLDSLNKDDIVTKFTDAHHEVLHRLSSCSVIPPSFGALSPSKFYKEGEKMKPPPPSPRDHTQTLLAKYPASSLHAATKTYRSFNSVDLSCVVNQVFAVIKTQDPMGNTEKWFVDNGEMQGFLPASCLRPFDPSCLSPVATQPRRLSNASASSNSPQPRPPSIASVSSNEMSAYVMEGADVTRGLSRRQSASPYTLRQGLSPTGQGQPSPVDVDNAFDDEEEMLSDVEYGEVGGVKKKKEFFLVEFDFISRSALELSVKPGDILTLIVPHDVEGNVEWWLMANVEGKQGYVPANYMTKAEYL